MILVALSDHCYGYEMILCGWTILSQLNFTLSLWVIYLWVIMNISASKYAVVVVLWWINRLTLLELEAQYLMCFHLLEFIWLEWVCFAVGIGEEEVTLTSQWIRGVWQKNFWQASPMFVGFCGGWVVANFQSSLLTPQPQRWPALHPSFVAQIFRGSFLTSDMLPCELLHDLLDTLGLHWFDAECVTFLAFFIYIIFCSIACWWVSWENCCGFIATQLKAVMCIISKNLHCGLVW